MKLNEFRLETYAERTLLSWALSIFEAERKDRLDDKERTALDALKMRISATQCQPGGCEMCGPGEPEPMSGGERAAYRLGSRDWRLGFPLGAPVHPYTAAEYAAYKRGYYDAS